MKIRNILLTLILVSVLAACSSGYAATENPSSQGAATEPISSPVVENTPTEAPAAASPTSEPMGNIMNFDVEISGFTFVENELTIHVGDTVTWVNHDSASHSVVANDGSFKSGTISNNDSFSFTFTTAGTYAYHCGFHSSMTGTVIVLP